MEFSIDRYGRTVECVLKIMVDVLGMLEAVIPKVFTDPLPASGTPPNLGGDFEILPPRIIPIEKTNE